MAEAPVQTDVLELDLRRYELRRGSNVLKLEKIPMELLILLVERRDQLVGREEIIARLWGKDVFLDTEQGINTAIRKIRLTLGDDPNEPRFLQTIVGKGYRFVGPITVMGARPTAASAPGSTSAIIEKTQLKRPKNALRWKLVALVFVFMSAGVAAIVFRYFDWIRWFPHPRVHSIAVLPLKNLSGNPADEYFADGMTGRVDHQSSQDFGIAGQLLYLGVEVQNDFQVVASSCAGIASRWNHRRFCAALRRPGPNHRTINLCAS